MNASRRMRAARIAVTALGFILAGTATADEPTATVVEFHNAALAHYFVTASAAEAAMLDAGGVPGWVRTGVTFRAWEAEGQRGGTRPVCRFFGTPGAGPNSHFYTADAAECEAVKRNPDWIYEGIAFHVELPAAGTCPADTQPVWRIFRPGRTVADSNHRFLPDLTMYARSGADAVREGIVMCAALSARDIEAEAVRLAGHATFGATQATIDAIRSMGAPAWIDAQLALPATRYTAFAPVPLVRPETCVDDRTPPFTATSFCNRDNYSIFQVQREFWVNAIHAPDQLRQRVAFALSQLLVISGLDVRLA